MKIYPSRIHQGLLVAVRVCLAATIALSVPHAFAQTPAPGPREVPAKTLPVPDTVSPQMQKLIAAPLTPTWNVIPNTPEGWKEQVNAGVIPARSAYEISKIPNAETQAVLAQKAAAGELSHSQAATC